MAKAASTFLSLTLFALFVSAIKADKLCPLALPGVPCDGSDMGHKCLPMCYKACDTMSVVGQCINYGGTLGHTCVCGLVSPDCNKRHCHAPAVPLKSLFGTAD